ncbi:hypothetical protein BJP34_16260 [Moorena producens PAL-8-15-08-1]|uniref:Uncharacterized protein n=1 Tax=Moorena producens PAL-8-15-08-1 TaxID=1458985 RepID=A0A1D8TT20_9CYAN|nr:hypothetical protein BJP34_16260 [Moorena producens PAL-8-15-08-1]
MAVRVAWPKGQKAKVNRISAFVSGLSTHVFDKKAKGKRQKARGKRQKARGKRQEAKGKRGKIYGVLWESKKIPLRFRYQQKCYTCPFREKDLSM